VHLINTLSSKNQQLAELRGSSGATHAAAALVVGLGQQQQPEAVDAVRALAIAARDAALAERDDANNRAVQAAKAQELLHTQVHNLKKELAQQAAENAVTLLEKERAIADCKARCAQCLQSFAAAQTASTAAALAAAFNLLNGDAPLTVPASKKRRVDQPAASQRGTITEHLTMHTTYTLYLYFHNQV
jgi:hypothetical protein